MLTAATWDGTTITGTGGDVRLYTGGPGILEYSNSGDSNFVLYGYSADSTDLLVNEIGPVSGQSTITTGPQFVTIEAVGDWSLTVRPV